MATLDYQSAFIQADNLRHNGKADEAIKAYVEIAQSARSLNNLSVLANALHMAGASAKIKVVDAKGSAFRDAINFYKESAALYKELDDNLALGRVYRDLAITCNYAKDFRGAEKYFTKSFELLSPTNNSAELALTYDKHGLYYFSRGDYQSALEKIETAQELIRQDPSEGFYGATILLDKAKVLYKIFEYEQAKESALESLGWFEADHGEKLYLRRKAQLYSLLFLIEGQLSDDRQAQQYYQKYQKLISEFEPEVAKVLEEDLKFLNEEMVGFK